MSMLHIKRRPLAGRAAAIACALPMLAGTAFAQDDIKTAVNGLSPETYWPLEYTIDAEVAAGTTLEALTFNAMHLHGPTLDFAEFDAYSLGTFAEVEYLPMFPDHLTAADGSTALVFSEEYGSPQGVDRYLEISPWTGTSPWLVQAIGMDDAFTLHAIAYPDADNSTQTLFQANYVYGYMELTTHAVKAVGRYYTFTMFDNTTSSTLTASTLVGSGQTGPGSTSPTGDPGDQIIVTFDPRNRTGPALTIEADNASTTTVGPFTLTAPTGPITSQNPPINSQGLFLGADDSEAQRYHGAMHHLAIWDRVLTGTEIDDLVIAAWTDEPAVPRHTVDWDADPQWFSWYAPSNGSPTAPSDPLDRSVTNWNDDFWDIPGVYPMIRVTISGELWDTPDYLAQQTYNKIDTVETNLQLMGKSLEDGVGYTIFWQNWGTGRTSYQEDPALLRQSTMRSWRDNPYEWRHNNDGAQFVHPAPNIPQSIDDDGNPYFPREHSTPYVREGVSITAQISKRAFVELDNLIDADPPGPIPIPPDPEHAFATPSRLHWDFESNFNMNDAVLGGNPVTENGWWDVAVADERVDVSRFWQTPDYDLDTLATYHAASPTHNWPEKENNEYRLRYWKLSNDTGEFALGNALLVPARDAFGTGIRMSNYGRESVGSFDGLKLEDPTDPTSLLIIDDTKYSPKYVKDNVFGLVEPNYPEIGEPLKLLDFSSTICYTSTNNGLKTYENIVQFWDMMGIRYDLSSEAWADDEALFGPRPDPKTCPAAQAEEAYDNLYVEMRKHDLNATYIASMVNGTADDVIPNAPWIPFSTEHWPVNGSGSNKIFTNFEPESPAFPDANVALQWPEIARVAVFAHRRGAREFMLWGSPQVVSTHAGLNREHEAVVETELIIQAVDYVHTNWLDYTHTNHLTRDDNHFGVPDGTIDDSDFDYFMGRFEEYDPEADVAGALSGIRPDGKLTVHDLNHYRGTNSHIADFDGDGCVSAGEVHEVDGAFEDYDVYVAAFGQIDCTEEFNRDTQAFCKYDLNEDGDIDWDDVDIALQEHLNNGCP